MVQKTFFFGLWRAICLTTFCTRSPFSPLFCPVRSHSLLLKKHQVDSETLLSSWSKKEIQSAQRNKIIKDTFDQYKILNTRKIPHFQSHGLRVGLAHLLVALGVSRDEICQYIGWRSEESAARYMFGIGSRANMPFLKTLLPDILCKFYVCFG